MFSTIAARVQAAHAWILKSIQDFNTNLKNIYTSITHSKSVQFIITECKQADFKHAFLMMCLFGWVPYAWAVATPVLLIYGYAKRDLISAYVKQTHKNIQEFSKNIFYNTGQSIAVSFKNNPWNVFKGFFSSMIFIANPGPYSLLMIYALYRPNHNNSIAEFYSILKNRFINIRDFLLGTYQGAGILGMTAILAGIIFFAGVAIPLPPMASVAYLSYLLGSMVLTTIGFSMLVRDIWEQLKQPLRFLTENMGPILGALAGNKLAYFMFVGRLAADIGPYAGLARGAGFFSALFHLFFPGQPGYPAIGGLANVGIAQALFQRLQAGIHTIVGNLFFNHDLTTYGTIYGVLGPTAIQLLAFMAAGVMVGYMADKAVRGLIAMMEEDYVDLKKSVQAKIWPEAQIVPQPEPQAPDINHNVNNHNNLAIVLYQSPSAILFNPGARINASNDNNLNNINPEQVPVRNSI